MICPICKNPFEKFHVEVQPVDQKEIIALSCPNCQTFLGVVPKQGVRHLEKSPPEEHAL